MKALKKVFLIALSFLVVLSSLFVFAEEDRRSADPLQVGYITNDYPVVGETLKVVVHYWTASRSIVPYIEEGDTGVTYQWYRNTEKSNMNGEPIAGAVNFEYTVTESDLGYYFYCIASGDGINYEGDAVTAFTVSPVSTGGSIGRAFINDSAAVDKQVCGYVCSSGIDMLLSDKRCLSGTIYGDNVLEYKWYKNKTESNIGGTLIENANSAKYTPTNDDIGYYLYFTAKGKNGYTGEAVSNVVYINEYADTGGEAAFVVSPSSRLNIIGSPVSGAVICSDDYVNMDWHEWYRNDVPENTGGELIEGVTGGCYRLTDEDIGKYIYVKYKRRDYYKNVVSPVTAAVKSSEELPSVEIESRAVRRYSVELMFNPKNPCFDAQWYRNDVPENAGGEAILGANNAEYIPTADDAGKYIYCVVKPISPFVGEPVTSNVTDKVLDVADIFFDENGGVDWCLMDRTVIVGKTMNYLPDESDVYRSGYILKGWSTDKKAKEPNFDENTIVTGDTTLYAVWEKIKTSGHTPNSGLSTGNNTAASPSPSALPSPSPTAVPAASPTPSAETIKFTDTKGHWAEEYINTAAKSGLIVGYEDGSFRPENAITIEEFVLILSRMSDKQIDILNNKFDITDPISREYAAYLLTRDISPQETKSSFTDILDSEYKTEIETAAALGIMIGNPDGTFAPNGNMTRAEAATVICRKFDLKQ